MAQYDSFKNRWVDLCLDSHVSSPTKTPFPHDDTANHSLNHFGFDLYARGECLVTEHVNKQDRRDGSFVQRSTAAILLRFKADVQFDSRICWTALKIHIGTSKVGVRLEGWVTV